MFGWAGWDTTSATFAFATLPVTFEPLMDAIPDPSDAIKRPCTFKPVRVPTLVMFGWAACDTTRATLAFATLPVTFEPLMFVIPDPSPNMYPAWRVPMFAVPAMLIEL